MNENEPKGFIVLEIQTALNGKATTITNDYEEESKADKRYHEILMYAADSDVPYHGATMLTKTGGFKKSDHYKHLPEPEPIPELNPVPEEETDAE